MKGVRVLLWTLLGLLLLLCTLINETAAKSTVSTTSSRSTGVPKKPANGLAGKQQKKQEEAAEVEEGEEVNDDDDDGGDEDHDTDDEDDERISFVDSTRVKTGADLHSPGSDFFTRVMLATRKRVVNSSAFKFVAEGKTFETVVGMLAWRFAMALSKDPTMGRKARLLFTMYIAMYMGYLLYVRSVALRGNDTRIVKVEQGAGMINAMKGVAKMLKLKQAQPEAMQFMKPQVVDMTYRKYDLEQVRTSFQRFTTWMGLMTYMHFRMKNISFIMYWGILGPIMLLREPLFQLYILGMDETGPRERPFGPKEQEEEVEEEVVAEKDGEDGSTDGTGGGTEDEVLVEEEEEEEEGEGEEVEEKEVEEEGEAEEEEEYYDSREKEEEDQQEEEEEGEGEEVVEEEEEVNNQEDEKEEEEEEEEEAVAQDDDDLDAEEEEEEAEVTFTQQRSARRRRREEEEEEERRSRGQEAVAEGLGAETHGGKEKPEELDDVYPPEDEEAAFKPDHFHVEKQRSDMMMRDDESITGRSKPGKVVVDKQQGDNNSSAPQQQHV